MDAYANFVTLAIFAVLVIALPLIGDKLDRLLKNEKPVRLDAIHAAAALVESEGHVAFRMVAQWTNNDVALALVVAHLRRSLGSMETWPPREDIQENVDAILHAHRYAEVDT